MRRMKKKSSVELLEERLIKLKIEDKVHPKKFDKELFLKDAKRVQKTFVNEDSLQQGKFI